MTLNHDDFRVVTGGLNQPAVQALLANHQQRMAEQSPPESRHVLNLNGLKKPEITFWSIWKGVDLVGCVALKHGDHTWGEIKSMKVAPQYTGHGLGKLMLEHVVQQGKARGYRWLKLETGSMAYFEPARQLYRRYGFTECLPFGNYQADSNNVFMSLNLQQLEVSA